MGLQLAGQVMMLDTAHNPNNNHPFLIAGSLDPLADSIAVRPITVRQCFVYDSYKRRIAPVRFLEVAPPKQRDPHSLKKARSHRLQLGLHFLPATSIWRLLPFDNKAVIFFVACK